MRVQWSVVLVVVATIALSASPLSAQTCWTCRRYIGYGQYNASCEPGPNMAEGNTDCEVRFDEPPTDCDFYGSWCTSNNPSCPDNNQNGLCDQDEGTIGNCGPYDPPDLCWTPLVIGEKRYEFSDSSDPVLFDLNADGVPDRITWTARGSGIHFLWLDLNHNGIVDDGRELFGNHTSRAAWNGFGALAQWDSAPYDGRIDPRDPIWPHLQLWDDANHDGISQPEEISRLADSNISALGLEYKPKKKEDDAGNGLRFRADLWRGHKKDKYYDVYFVLLDKQR
jgi:hypothetical protein